MLTNVSKLSGSLTSVLGLEAPSMSTRMLYRPPLSNMGPSIMGRPSPRAKSAPAMGCVSPYVFVHCQSGSCVQEATGLISTLSSPSVS